MESSWSRWQCVTNAATRQKHCSVINACLWSELLLHHKKLPSIYKVNHIRKYIADLPFTSPGALKFIVGKGCAVLSYLQLFDDYLASPFWSITKLPFPRLKSSFMYIYLYIGRSLQFKCRIVSQISRALSVGAATRAKPYQLSSFDYEKCSKVA